jgi:hypothetical protein
MKAIFTGQTSDYDAEVLLEISGVTKRAPTRGAITETPYRRYGQGPVVLAGIYVSYRVLQCTMSDENAYRLAYQIGWKLFGDYVEVPKTFDLEDIAGQMLAGWNIVKRRRVDMSNPMQRAVGGYVSVERFLELDGLYASLAEWGIEGLLNCGVALPESTMPSDKVEAALLVLHDNPEKVPANPHPYLKRMLARMQVLEKWDAIPKGN